MGKFILFVITFSVLLSGCASDANLSKDIVMPTSTTTPTSNLSQPESVSSTTPAPSIKPSPSPATVKGVQTEILVSLNTSKGLIKLKLYGDKAPKTVENFITKAKSGFYKELKFHRVEDWVIQGGDPTGTGRGGSDMPSEINSMPFKAGSLGIARGADIKINNDSQFFICTKDCDWLNNQYTNFGEVVAGMDVALKIAVGDTIKSIIID